MENTAEVSRPRLDHSAVQAIARQQIEDALREMLAAFPDEKLRRGALVHYLAGRLSLDPLLVARFCGEAIFSQQFEGRAATEQRQALLIAANGDDEEVFKFLLYSKVGDELKTGGGAAPACTLRRVS